MKKIIFLSITLLSIIFASCEYDNYDAPSLTFSGNVVYNGKNLQWDGSAARTILRVFQTGYGKVDTGTFIQVKDDGSFNQLLFHDEYWLTPYNNQFPFEFSQFNYESGVGYDSIYIDMKNDLQMDIEVTPYYELSELSVGLEGDNIVMRCNVSKVTGTKNPTPVIKNVRGYISTTKIVNSTTTCAITKAVEVDGSADLEVSIPVATYQNGYVNNFRDYAFCRVAIELENIPNYYLFTEVKKIEGLPVNQWVGSSQY